jgi:DNA-directed RNA polymerase specialized sigma24 family protein
MGANEAGLPALWNRGALGGAPREGGSADGRKEPPRPPQAGRLSLTPKPAMSQPLSPLDRLLRASTESEEDAALEAVAAEATPVIRRVVRAKLATFGRRAAQEAELAEDLTREALLNVLREARRLRDNPDGPAIRSLEGLADTVARNVIRQHWRERFPRRASLRGQLLYLLNGGRAGGGPFAVWEFSRDRLCGFREWIGRPLQLTARYRTLRENPRAFAADRRHADSLTDRLDRFLEALFRWLETPIELDDLVGTAARLRGVEDQPESSLDAPIRPEEGEGARPEPASEVPSPERQAVLTAALRRAWEEIRRLPARQRAVLLLNLRDHRDRGVIELLPILGIAGFNDLAACMELSREQLAEHWNDLPLDDRAIGGLLGITPGYVAVLRLRARDRLSASLPGLFSEEGN